MIAYHKETCYHVQEVLIRLPVLILWVYRLCTRQVATCQITKILETGLQLQQKLLLKDV